MTVESKFSHSTGIVLCATASHVAQAIKRVGGSALQLVALTAEALQALEDAGLPYDAALTYGVTRRLAALEPQINQEIVGFAEEIERFIAKRYAPAHFDGPGFLSGQGYHLQFALTTIATRLLLIQAAIDAHTPANVSVFAEAFDPWILGHTYTTQWLEPLVALAQERDFRLEIIGPEPLAQSMNKRLGGRAKIKRIELFLHDVYSYLRRNAPGVIRRILHAVPVHLAGFDDLAGLRLLFADSLGYDWGPVLADLQTIRGMHCFRLGAAALDQREWTYHYAPALRRLWHRELTALDIAPPLASEEEQSTLGALYDEWLRLRVEPPTLNLLGMDMFPAMSAHLRELTCLSPALVRHTDKLAEQALDIAQPHAVCFFAMPYLAAKRLSYHCRRRKIPVMCYQHGGAYGTHISVAHEQLELAHADYFLTYGPGIRPPATPVFPLHAHYVPVGSTRATAMMTNAQPKQQEDAALLKVLWISEATTGNTTGGTFQVEDTERYTQQRRCLEQLGRATHLRVTFRPYRSQCAVDGTTNWLATSGLPILVDVARPLAELIRAADIVISDNSSGTVWNETLALGKPMILYCDPQQTSLMPHFATDLAYACWWCRSGEDLLLAVGRLADEGATFVAEVARRDARAFLRDYVLNGEDALSCVRRVVTFLNMVCRHGQSVEEWEQTWPTPHAPVTRVEQA